MNEVPQTGNVVVTGASSGLGKLIAHNMTMAGFTVHNWSLDTGVNVTRQAEIDFAASQLNGAGVLALVNCAGINVQCPIDDNGALGVFDQLMNVNARAFLGTTRALLGNLQAGSGVVCNIVSNASRIPMTYSSAYNASKGAAAILSRQMHRELFATHGIPVFSVSPNKLAGTGMSDDIDRQVCQLRGWTPDQARQYQLNALAVKEETDPEALAEFIAFLLSEKRRHKYLGGCDLEYGA